MIEANSFMITFIPNTISFENIKVNKTISELRITKIKTSNTEFIIVNLHIPPYRSKNVMIDELKQSIKEVQKLHKNTQILIIGDFNMSGTNWEFDDEFPEFLIQSATTLTTTEDKFVKSMNNLCMYQVNSHKNKRGKFLDLIFTSEYRNVTTTPANELIDDNISHHSAIHIEISIEDVVDQHEIITKNSINVNLNKSHAMIIDAQFDLITDEEINLYRYLNDKTAMTKVSNIINTLYNIQYDCTSNTKNTAMAHISNQPWTVGNNKYVHLYQNKLKAKNNYNRNSNDQNKSLLKIAHVELYSLYKVLKNKYYEDLILNVKNDLEKFIKLCLVNVTQRKPFL